MTRKAHAALCTDEERSEDCNCARYIVCLRNIITLQARRVGRWLREETKEGGNVLRQPGRLSEVKEPFVKENVGSELPSEEMGGKASGQDGGNVSRLLGWTRSGFQMCASAHSDGSVFLPP